MNERNLREYVVRYRNSKHKIHADSECVSRKAFKHYRSVDKLRKPIAYASVIRYRRSCFSTYAQTCGTSQALVFEYLCSKPYLGS
jgi:hypothetical protein